MLKFRGRKTLITILLFFCILLCIIFIPTRYSFSDYLSKTDRVKANILIVDGCLFDDNLEMACEEFQKNGYEYIITTGLISPDYYMVHSNGYLVFYTKKKIYGNNKVHAHVIEIDAYSELGGENSARFNVFVNDSMVADFLAVKKKRKYAITWEGKLTDIDSIMVQFVNDGIGDYGDRNLYVKEIIIDHKAKISYQNNSEYDIGALDGRSRIINNFNSNAELARNRLLSMGINSSLIKAVPGKRVKINRTLTSALAFRDWLKTTDIDIKGINIISMGTHASRTWMTYNKILNEKYDIGIISLPDYQERYSRKYKVLKTLRETIGIIYYWFILIPY